jgi:hypothetical protein
LLEILAVGNLAAEIHSRIHLQLCSVSNNSNIVNWPRWEQKAGNRDHWTMLNNDCFFDGFLSVVFKNITLKFCVTSDDSFFPRVGKYCNIIKAN